ncbi:hypothetical protein ACPA9J_15085 [Pseudomonas aeruginosa]
MAEIEHREPGPGARPPPSRPVSSPACCCRSSSPRPSAPRSVEDRRADPRRACPGADQPDLQRRDQVDRVDHRGDRRQTHQVSLIMHHADFQQRKRLARPALPGQQHREPTSS